MPAVFDDPLVELGDHRLEVVRVGLHELVEHGELARLEEHLRGAEAEVLVRHAEHFEEKLHATGTQSVLYISYSDEYEPIYLLQCGVLLIIMLKLEVLMYSYL